VLAVAERLAAAARYGEILTTRSTAESIDWGESKPGSVLWNFPSHHPVQDLSPDRLTDSLNTLDVVQLDWQPM
jgi:hypothetical protein